jgi:hypothetical protein
MHPLCITSRVSTLGQGDQTLCLPAHGFGLRTGGLDALVFKQLLYHVSPQSITLILTAA